MKTNLHFSIESKELTKQILETAEAEAIHKARITAEKSFEKALTSRVEAIIKNLDKDLQPEYWRGSKLKNLITDTIKNEIINAIKNDNELRQQIISAKTQEINEFRRECVEALSYLKPELKKYIDSQIKTVLQNTLLTTLVTKILKEDKPNE